MVSLIISNMFQGKTSLICVFLLLLSNFTIRSRSELMHVFLIESNRSSTLVFILLTACAAAMTHENNKPAVTMGRVRQMSNHCKRVESA